MKTLILAGTTLSLTLATAPVFALGSAELPTAESAAKKSCKSAVELAKTNMDDLIKQSKAFDGTDETMKAHQRQFSHLAASYVVEAISDMKALRNSLRATMLDLSKTYMREINKVEKAHASGEMPIGVYLDARTDLYNAYRGELHKAILKGIKNAGFNDAGEDVTGAIRINKGRMETGGTLRLDIGSNDSVKVEYTQRRAIGKPSQGYISSDSKDILFSDEFLVVIDDVNTVNLGVGPGSYGRAGITPTDSDEIKTQKMAARFVEVSGQPRSFDNAIAEAAENLKKKSGILRQAVRAEISGTTRQSPCARFYRVPSARPSQ